MGNIGSLLTIQVKPDTHTHTHYLSDILPRGQIPSVLFESSDAGLKIEVSNYYNNKDGHN